MLIEHSQLSEDILRAIAQQYICSNLSGVESEMDMEQWTDQVVARVKKGELLIDYSENNESVYLRKPEEIVQDE